MDKPEILTAGREEAFVRLQSALVGLVQEDAVKQSSCQPKDVVIDDARRVRPSELSPRGRYHLEHKNVGLQMTSRVVATVRQIPALPAVPAIIRGLFDFVRAGRIRIPTAGA